MTKKILIVDDESAILYGLSRYLHKLEDFDVEIITAQDGHTAFNILDRNFFDLCFLDINLPDINGLEIMKKINKFSPETRIAIMTAGDVDDNMKWSINESSSFFIQKPLDLSRVKTFVMHTLSASGKERRTYKRYPFKKTFECNLNIYNNDHPPQFVLEADIIDVSDRGIGILTGFSLEPGNTVRCACSKANMPGTVRWNMPGSNHYRAGIEFISQK